MIRPCLLASLAVLTGAVFVGAGQVANATSSEDPSACEYWSPVSSSRPVQRKYHLAEFPRGYEFPGRQTYKGRLVNGRFYTHVSMIVAFWVENRFAGLAFTIPAGSTIDFVPDGERTAIKVIGGWADFDTRTITSYPSITCPPSDATARSVRPPLSLSREPEKPLSDLANKYNKGTGSEPEKPKPAEAPKSLKKLGEAIAESGTARKNAPSDLQPAEPMAEAMRRAVTPDAAKPSPKKVYAVCAATTLQPLETLDEGSLTNLQLVGLRNRRTEVGGSDYLNVSGDLLPLDYTFDVTDSVGKLVAYEPVSNAAAAGKGPELAWVSLPGQPRLVTKAKSQRAVPMLLKAIVVGGAPEVVFSGFDRVSAELRKISRGQARVEIAWYMIESTGAARFVAQYSSFEELIKAATERVGDGRPAALNEGQIETLLEGLERILTSQPAPVDKIYWLKGAYSLPSSFPARFERLLGAVSESKAVARAPTGTMGKWLAVITARMPGFSVAYLKEPIYSMQIGDVIEEVDTRSETRRFIDDPNMAAVRLRAAGAMRLAAQPAPAAGPDTPNLAGTLVHPAKDLFDQRGYLLSPEAAATLHRGLRAVLQMWATADGAASVKDDAVKEAAARMKKSAPSLGDVLQDLPGGVSLRLPRGLPDWIRKPLKDLNGAESQAAHSFVVRYAAGVEKLNQNGVKLAEAVHDHACALTFVPEESFGFPKL